MTSRRFFGIGFFVGPRQVAAEILRLRYPFFFPARYFDNHRILETVRKGKSQRSINNAFVRSVVDFIASAQPLARDFNADFEHLAPSDAPCPKGQPTRFFKRCAGARVPR